MAGLALNLTQHPIILAVGKRERGVGLQAILANAGLKATVVISIYEAERAISQELPHLVFMESHLDDGDANILHDKLRTKGIFDELPVLVQIVRKTRKDVEELAKRKFAGFFLGAIEPGAFLAKIKEVLGKFAGFSPYMLRTNAAVVSESVTVSTEAAVLGKSAGQVISRSGVELDDHSTVQCVPRDSKLHPALFRSPSNVKVGEDLFNLFPLNKVSGKGRLWLDTLPEMKLGQKARMRRVLFYDPNEDRFKQFKPILEGHNIFPLYAKNLHQAVAMLQTALEDLSCIYLYELSSDAGSIAWRTNYAKLPATRRPALVVGTTSVNARSVAPVRYIKRPFGLGQFIELLESAFCGSDTVALNAENGAEGIKVSYQLPARLVGIDERGGVLEFQSPVALESRLNLDNEFWNSIGTDNSQVIIKSVVKIPNVENRWHARFESVQVGISREKYWSRVLEVYANRAKVEDAQTAQDIA